MRYPLLLTPDPNGGFVVTFPDVPEAITQGEDEADALRHGADALESALDFYFEAKRPVPVPSQTGEEGRTVDLPASLSATVLLFNEMLRQQVRPIDLARRMKLPKQEINRMLSRRHRTKIDTVAEALHVLGKRLELSVAP